jgi:hypothetical protein
MTLGEKRRQFTTNAMRAVAWALGHGYGIAGGEWTRTDEQAAINALGPKGRMRLADVVAGEFPALAEALRNNPPTTGALHTVHEFGLGWDVLLYRGDQYLSQTEAYQPLGEYWESLHEDNVWGGRFPPPTGPDGGHLSMRHGGRA